jgi:hypothetical protein
VSLPPWLTIIRVGSKREFEPAPIVGETFCAVLQAATTMTATTAKDCRKRRRLFTDKAPLSKPYLAAQNRLPSKLIVVDSLGRPASRETVDADERRVAEVGDRYNHGSRRNAQSAGARAATRRGASHESGSLTRKRSHVQSMYRPPFICGCAKRMERRKL